MRPLLASLLMLLLAGCTPPAAAGVAGTTAPPASRVDFSGKVVLVRLEGGFCGLVAADGRRFDPVNLPADFCQDGLAVRVSGETLPAAVSMRMWGTRLRIETIRRQ